MRSRGRATFRKPTNSWEPRHFGYARGPEPCSADPPPSDRLGRDGRWSATVLQSYREVGCQRVLLWPLGDSSLGM